MMTMKQIRQQAQAIAAKLNDPDTPSEDRADLSMELSVLQSRLGAQGVEKAAGSEED